MPYQAGVGRVISKEVLDAITGAFEGVVVHVVSVDVILHAQWGDVTKEECQNFWLGESVNATWWGTSPAHRAKHGARLDPTHIAAKLHKGMNRVSSGPWRRSGG